MSELKKNKAEYLLREIGEIDDSLVHEAQFYRPERSSRPRLLLIAAAFVLVFALVIGTPLISKLVSPKAEGEEDVNLQVYALDALISESDTAKYTFVSTSSDLPYFDGGAHVVWQTEDTDGYYVSDTLSKRELSELSASIGKGESVGDTSPEFECKVWILYGDGRVVTPYLKASSGNVSGEVFDYEAEIIPTDSFVSCISDILS